MTSIHIDGSACPLPLVEQSRVQLGHGSGGKLSAALLRSHFLPPLKNPYLEQLGDGAVVPVAGAEVVLSTDTFVVHPLEFPGGNIGTLAVHGTLNDVAMMGAVPMYLTAGFVLEEGLPLDLLDRIVGAMASAAATAGVPLVTGDTKVVERGRADGMYVNTTGLGILAGHSRPGPHQAEPGDDILVSGPIGRHGMAIMAVREGLEFESAIVSDTANLTPLVHALNHAAGSSIAVLRDPTRGGLASALNEIAQASRVGIAVEESLLPIPGEVRAACDILGLDPCYVANEGVLITVVRPSRREAALAALRSHPLGREACWIGRVVPDHPGYVVMRTVVGGSRVMDLLPGDQLPRIC